MTAPGRRHERVAEEIHHEVAGMVSGELKDPRIVGLVTITEVRVSPDLRHARVFVSVMGSPDEQDATMQGLSAAAGFVRREIGERLRLRRSPEVHFVLDQSAEYGQRIEDLLRKVKKSP